MTENDSSDLGVDAGDTGRVTDFDPAVDDEIEESGLAAKTLKIAGLLLAGAVFALWAGPRIAPKLPSGMAPVAQWLAPGGAANDAEIAALHAAVTQFPEPVSKTEIETLIAAQNRQAAQDIEMRINALADQIKASDSADIEARLAVLESKFDGLRAEQDSLFGQLANVSESGGVASAETSAQIAAYAAVTEGLKAEIAALAAQNGALSQKIDGVSVVASRQVAEAENKVSEIETNAELERNAAKIDAGLNAIDVALSAGLPFGAALGDLEAAGIAEVPVALADASGGVATMSELRAAFPEAAHAAIRASILASSGDGIFASIGAFARAQVAGRSLTPQDGVGPDAVLSRAEDALKRDDLAGALAEIDALPAVAMPSEGRGPMGDWVADATARMDALNAFDELLATQSSE